MRKTLEIIWYSLIIIPLVTMFKCHHDTSSIVDKGVWVQLNETDSIHNLYLLYNGKIRFQRSSNDSLFDSWIDVDIPTFKVCKNSDYAKDKNTVYYPIDTIHLVSDNFWIIYTDNFIVEGADPNTFKYIGDGYAVDKYNMYYRGEVVPWNENKIQRLHTNHQAI